MKNGKIYTSYALETPSTNHEDPLSPCTGEKKDLPKPRKPLSAYIYFSQEYRELLKE